MVDIRHALARAQASGLDRLDAQLLLLQAFGIAPADFASRRTWLLAHCDDEVPEANYICFEQYLRRRAAGEPLAYVTGYKQFFGLDLEVDARVLVPRPDTETLVMWALELLAGPIADEFDPPLTALDLGTGSGAVALALKHSLPELRVDAVDFSADAVAVARANAEKLGLPVRVRQNSWLRGIRRRYHCIVGNPPYIAAQDPHLGALNHEPAQALVSGPDGLHDIRHIVGAAKARLHQGAWLLLEHGYDQAAAVRAMFSNAGYDAVSSRQDLGGRERCTGGQNPGTLTGENRPSPAT